MVRNYSCYVTTRRWPVVVFCNMVDVAAINAFTLWIENNPDYLESGSKFKGARHELLIALGMELVKPYIKRRAENPQGFSNHVRKAIGEVLGRNIIDPVPEQEEARTQSNYVLMKLVKLLAIKKRSTTGRIKHIMSAINAANISVAPTAKRGSNLFVIIATICYHGLNKDSDL